MGSSAYWWGRLAAAGGRVVHYVLGYGFALEARVHAGAWEAIAGGEKASWSPFMGYWSLKMLGYPVKASRYSGGLVVDYIGYWQDFTRVEVGVSESRAR